MTDISYKNKPYEKECTKGYLSWNMSVQLVSSNRLRTPLGPLQEGGRLRVHALTDPIIRENGLDVAI